MDRLCLVLDREDKKAKQSAETLRSLLGGRVKVREEHADVWDLHQCLEKFRRIIERERGNQIALNVSMGTEVTTTAGMLACMLWGPEVQMFCDRAYVRHDPNKPSARFVPIETLSIPSPKKEALAVLRILASQPGQKIRRGRLIEILYDRGVIAKKQSKNDKQGNPKEFTSQAKQSQLNSILGSIRINPRCIEIQDVGKRCEIVLTKLGLNVLRIFQGQFSDYLDPFGRQFLPAVP